MKPLVLVVSLGLAAATLLSIGSCSSSTDTTDALRFTDQWSGNVSSMVGTPGRARDSLRQGYAPDFRWHRSDGSLDSLTNHQGKIVVLNFWATWCTYCKEEMPSLNEVATDLADTVDVIGISTDNTGDVFSVVNSYIQSHKYSYQVVIDSNYKLYNRYLLYSTTGIPQTFLVDPNGTLRFAFAGEVPKATLLKYIRALE